ncbi:MAG: c-type cytochrome domain-containing protein [Chitinophagia bacterium]|jgi:uncharacterized membrane protein/DNA-binding CsgD family transcriptional regulator
MQTIITIIGKLHPILVHLPIGILLLAIFFQWISNKEKYAALEFAIRPAYLIGMLSAAIAVVSGWLLADSGTYPEQILFVHRLLGISVCIGSIAGYFLLHTLSRQLQNMFAGIFCLLIIAAGHYGGTLTHGAGYLFANTAIAEVKPRAPITQVQDALVFSQLVQPILNEKCVGCHGPNKQKGKLRLDDSTYLIQGGEHGAVFKMGAVNESEIFKRISLNPLDEQHMPPKGKPALTEQEMAIINWWISSGANWHTKVKELVQPEPIKNLLNRLEKPTLVKRTSIPKEPVTAASLKIIAALQAAGVMTVPVAANSNYLSVNLINLSTVSDSVIQLLEQVQPQIIWIKADYQPATPKLVAAIAACKQVTRLSWTNGKLSDSDVSAFRSLSSLQYLNLSNNPIGREALMPLQSLSALQSLYVWNTKITSKEIASLATQFPHTQIDSGNYKLAMIAADTIPVKAPPVK